MKDKLILVNIGGKLLKITEKQFKQLKKLNK